MSHTDRTRKAKRPEHADAAPRFQPRPAPRRAKTRRQALLAALRDFGPVARHAP